MKIAVIGHHSRSEQAERLARSIDAELFMDEGDHGAAWNHRRALSWGSWDDQAITVLEDDAMPVAGFMERLGGVQDRWTDDLVSLYLGTGRPPQWQGRIRQELKLAELRNIDWIELPMLIHGVAYILPRPGDVLKTLGDGPIDFAIGNAWRKLTGRNVIYTIPSMVDHADGPSVELHADGQPRREVRKAWILPSA